jgi:hypothetical protein
MKGEEDHIQCQVLVYGGTVAGIAAALAAAQMGCETVLIERGDHFGGMMASGLGAPDTLREKAFGGIFAEFLRQTREHYIEKYGRESDQYRLTHDGLFMEPHVAESILDEMIRSRRCLRSMKRLELIEVVKRENRVTGSVYRNRDTGEKISVSHEVAIDGTYEGDFAAATGVEYRVGREGRAEYDEKLAGVIFFDHRYHRQEILPQSTGEPSPYIQANCFRLTVSDSPDRVRFSKPAGYDDLYRHYYKWLPHDFERGRIRHLHEIIWLTPLSNRKYCVNGHIEALTSPNLAEFSVEWAEGDWATRDRLYRYYKEYTEGLWYFLQNDLATPLVPRTDAFRFGLPPDEYEADGNFPWQLYVRQARRIKGVYVITEHDSIPPAGRQRPHIHKDTIGVSEHGFDSHPCRDRNSKDAVITAADGFELLEGVIYFKNRMKTWNRPTTIPYRALVPEKVDGLLVPVALSATSVAYTSIRMEAVWMTTGEAAGVAAAQAIAQRVQVRNVDILGLQKALLRQKHALTYFENLSATDAAFESTQLSSIEEDCPHYDLAAFRATA